MMNSFFLNGRWKHQSDICVSSRIARVHLIALLCFSLLWAAAVCSPIRIFALRWIENSVRINQLIICNTIIALHQSLMSSFPFFLYSWNRPCAAPQFPPKSLRISCA